MSTLINPRTTPQVYTDDGRSIEGGGRLDGVELDDTGKVAVSAGRLVVEDEPKKSRRGQAASTTTESSTPEEGDAESEGPSARRAGKSTS